MSEGELQSDVIDLAHRHGWRVAHFRTSQTGGRWVTAVAADGSGFPDLVLAKPGRAVLFVELKREANDLSEDQKTWKGVIDASTTATVEVWRPSDWFSGLIEARLTAPG
jgi:hypothetical protein